MSLLTQIRELTREAGAEVLRVYGRTIRVERKADQSPLTEADQASHEFIVEALKALEPAYPVISEESTERPNTSWQEAGKPYWLVDPLDGTKEFLKRTGEFTVNIALIEAGCPVLGVVHAPAIALTYFAERGKGTRKQEGESTPVAVRTRSACAGKLSVVASKDHAGPQVQKMLDRLPGATLTSLGSSLKFCLVAEGKADLYLRDVPTMEWDTAAAQCIVEEAGGGVFTLDGYPLRYGKDLLRNPVLITVGDLEYGWKEVAGAGGGD